MTDIGKLLREKLTISTGGGGGVGNVTWSNTNIPTKWELPPDPAMEEARYMIGQIDYILQRIVPNYDELVAQYRAIKDIEEAGK